MNIDPRQIERWSRHVEESINKLARNINVLNKFQMTVEYENQVEAAQHLIERLQSNLRTYTHLIVAAGYAGFFAFWSMLREGMPPWLYALAGLLITISLVLFIGWEVAKMIWGAIHLNRVQKNLVSKPPSPEIIAQLQNSLSAFERRANRLWIWFLVPTIAFGLAASMCLLAHFSWRLWSVFN
jgi:hypothetical protein